MSKQILLIAIIFFIVQTLTAQNNIDEHKHHHTHEAPSLSHMFSLAPISIMGDHIHHKGAFMISYRFMHMNMENNLRGNNNIDDSEVFSEYMVSPQNMSMNMHMFGIMYAPADIITFMLMSNYSSNSMSLKSQMGMEFDTKSSGIGDTKFTTLVQFLNNGKSSLLTGLGICIPSGDIDQRGDTPMMKNMQLAYPMQLGSGTLDPFLIATYLHKNDKVEFGLQSKYKTRIGENEEDYNLGNEFISNAWGVYKASNAISFSIRALYVNNESINGVDEDLNAMMMPLANTKNSGMHKIDLYGGINLYQFDGIIKGIKVGAEVGYPVYQDLTGIQMKRNLTATIGVQYNLINH